MRVLALLLLVTGCRFGFDALVASGDRDAFDTDGAPVPTCTGHDEDGDGFPDACDDCPTIADPGQLDRGEILAGASADGVGDACDPRPSIGGDYIQVFDAHANSATTTYYQLNGSTSWQGDALRIGALGLAGGASYQLPALPSRLETRMHVIAASTTALQWFGFWYSQVQNDASKVFAEAADMPGDATNIELNIKEDNMGVTRYSTFLYGPPVYAPGDTYTMIIETSLVTGADDVLHVTDPAGTTRTTSLAVQVPRDVYGFLDADETSIDFDYFIAYGIR